MARVQTPKSKIAEYWLATAEGRARLPVNETSIDWGEPNCFACGWWATRADEAPELWSVWNRAALDRCHLVPAALGGEDEPENLVLLCIQCHQDAPDVADPTYMLRWIERRESWINRGMRLLQKAFEDADLANVAETRQLAQERVVHVQKELMRTWAGVHGRGFSEGTMAAVAVEAVRRVLAESPQDLA